MLVTKHAAELSALLVSDLHGELPSRILLALLTKGRLSVTQIGQHTALNPRHVRNGLGVLNQQNLLYHRTDPDSGVTTYEANSDACYNLVRSGKILQTIEEQYGVAERDLVQALMLFGHARIDDLVHACESRRQKPNGQTNGSHDSPRRLIETQGHLHSVLARLIQHEIIDTVRPDSFRNPVDVYQEIEAEVTKTKPGEKATKNKIEQHSTIVDRYRNYLDQGRRMKRQLDQSEGPPSGKRRKLQNGDCSNGNAIEFEDSPDLDPNAIVRVNYERCLVELRNQRLAHFATDTFGEVTGEVYRALLELVTARLPTCRVNGLLGGNTSLPSVSATAIDIFEQLGEDINVFRGIGKAPGEKIDTQRAEKVRQHQPGFEDESDDEETRPAARGSSVRMAEDNVSESEASDDEALPQQNGGHSTGANGDRTTRVKFEDHKTTRDSRINQMRQHLLLLSDSRHGFARHCGTAGRGQWTVDFEPLVDRLRESELDAFVDQSFGRHGLRLTKVLREKGKLDEKMLHTAALMKKSDVQGKMLAMQMAGLVDVQEVPRDNSRMANRTMFFWFFDAKRTRSQLLDDVYKTMLRCLQTLHVERHRERSILSFVERVDVQGKEEEVMTSEHYNKYNRHLEIQNKLLGQVMRLDEIVGIFRDY